MLTVTERDISDNEDSASLPKDIEETRRSADVRSPLTGNYDIPEMMNHLLGRESATCEACQETISHPEGGDLKEGDPFVIRRLVENVYTAENFVLLCKTCIDRPSEEWRAEVREKRAKERDKDLTWIDHLDHWLSDPTAMSLFARRMAGAFTAATGLVAIVTIMTTIAGGLTGGISTGTAWGRTVLTTVWTAGRTLVAHPWVVGGIIAVGYTAHAIERVRYDPRGYLPRNRPPWVALTVAGVLSGVGALVLLGTTSGLLPSTSVVILLAGGIWAIGAAGVAWYIDPALRHDLYDRIWYPDRRLWMIAGRVGVIPGLLAITVGVPFEGMLPETTTAVLAAIPAGVAFAFTGRRLPHDPQARDTILETLPERILELLQNRE